MVRLNCVSFIYLVDFDFFVCKITQKRAENHCFYHAIRALLRSKSNAFVTQSACFFPTICMLFLTTVPSLCGRGQARYIRFSIVFLKNERDTAVSQPFFSKTNEIHPYLNHFSSKRAKHTRFSSVFFKNKRDTPVSHAFSAKQVDSFLLLSASLLGTTNP